MKSSHQKQNILLFIAVFVVALGIFVSSGVFGLNWRNLEKYVKFPITKEKQSFGSLGGEKVKVVTEESVVIDVVEKVSPSVVTIGITKTRKTGDIFQIDPFDPFAPFMAPRRGTGKTQKIDSLLFQNRHRSCRQPI